MRKQLMLTALLAVALPATAPAAPPDDAWLAFIGCWRADGDTSERALCIVPDGDGVRNIVLNGTRVESESRIVANGQPRTISQEGCTGTETAVWSADRYRLFINADLNCGNGVTRKVSGVFAVLSTSQWSSVQSITTADNTTMHTVRYVEATPASLPQPIAQAIDDKRLARQTVRLAAASLLSLDDVQEAVAQMAEPAVAGWITTVGQEFDLNGQDLIRLADAGVPSSIIDVLVAVSNPGHFAVREERAVERNRGRGGVYRPGSCYDYFYDPYNPYYYSYNCRGGWGWYPWYGGGYYGGGSVIVIDRPSTFKRGGKVTRDGYKAPRDTNGTVSRAPERSNSGSSTGSTGSSSDSGSSSSDGGGRKAKPRDN